MELPIQYYSPIRSDRIDIEVQNADATMPLTIPVNMLCNVPDEERMDNIRVNSAADMPWVDLKPEHDGVAVVVGSGPSAALYIDEIQDAQDSGCTVFALNGACRWLNSQDITPDHQIMADGRRENLTLVGHAKHHYFASQCHPDVVRSKYSTLFHILWEHLDECLPTPQTKPYTIVGSAPTVGNMALFLLYILGYRKFVLFGYDSCDDVHGASHVVRQKLNDGEAKSLVRFEGNTYTASLSMKRQAEDFVSIIKPNLLNLGCSFDIRGSGLLPDMDRSAGSPLTEAEKYERVWNEPRYGFMSPAERIADEIDAWLPKDCGKVLDLGCGSGKGGVELAKRGRDVVLVDFVENSRVEAALSLPFIKADISETCPEADYAFCCDVMEHLPPENVSKALNNIALSVRKGVLFRIDFHHDYFGPTIMGRSLHLSVHDEHWWAEELSNYWPVVRYVGNGIYHVRTD